jgi:hypothetical protein
MKKFNCLPYSRNLFAAAMVTLASLGVQAELRLEIPTETFGPPFYARLEFPHVDPDLIPNNGQWAALVMYRHSDCIPDDFNLLEIFDVPAAFDCPLNNFVGYEVYENAPGVDPAPIRSRLTAAGSVPVWFVHLADFEQAASDGVITIADFEAMPSLRIASADFYDELLRPSQSNPAGFIHITARGSFENGDQFRLTYTINGAFGPEHGSLPHSVRTRIEFLGEGAGGSDDPMVFPFTGHWFDPADPGQGIGLHPVRARDYMFGTFYAIDELGQQVWYALDSADFDGLKAEFSVLLSHGADPDNPPHGVLLEEVGEMTIEFLGCRAARASYLINNNEGAINLLSLIPADDCRD